MKKKLKSLAPIALFVLGAGVFLYPYISNKIVLYFQSQEIHTYEAKISDKSKADIDKLFHEAEIYNDNLAGDPLHDPFLLNSGYVLPDNYLEVLNIGEDGSMGYLEIPTIDVNIPIYHGTSDKVLQKGVGHIEGTSLPIGGNNRHSIMCAHRGLPSAKLFTDLDELKKGDLFYIHVLDETHAYEVDQIKVIEPEDINEHIQLSDDKDWITLMTCTPYGVNTHRLLVRGERTAYTAPDEKEHNGEKQGHGLLVFVAAVVLVVLFILWKRRRAHHE